MADLTESEKKMIREHAEFILQVKYAAKGYYPQTVNFGDCESLLLTFGSELLLAMKERAAQIAETCTIEFAGELVGNEIRNFDFGDLFKEKV